MFAQITNVDPRAQEWAIRSDPVYSLAVLALIAGVCLFFVIWFYRREAGEASNGMRRFLIVIRVALIVLVLLMAQGWSIHPFIIDLPDLVVLIDDSKSMSIADAETVAATEGDAPTRLQKALRLLTDHDADRMRRWTSRYRLQLYTLSGECVSPTNDVDAIAARLGHLKPDYDRSPLASEVKRLLQMQRGRSTAAMVILSDGNSTDRSSMSDVARQAKQQNTPLFSIGFGRDCLPADVALGDLAVDPACFVGEVLTFDATATVTNANAGEVSLRLFQEGLPEPIQEATVKVEEGITKYRMRMSHRANEPGIFAYRLEARTTDQEVDLANNQTSATVEVRDETLKVLLVAAAPCYEYRYLKTLLSRSTEDELDSLTAFELSSVLQDADPEYEGIDQTALTAFPPDLEALLRFDVVVLCDVNPKLLRPDALADVSDYVSQHGRAVVVIAGPRHLPAELLGTASERLLPFELQAPTRLMDTQQAPTFRLRLTSLGELTPFLRLVIDDDANRELWRQLPEMYWRSPIDRLKPGVRVLAESTSSGRELSAPLICLQYLGAGRTLYHAIDETYRWRYLRGDELFGRYWLQALRFLGRVKVASQADVQLVVDQNRFQPDERIELRAIFPDSQSAPASDQGVVVALERTLGRRQQVVLTRDQTTHGRFAANIDRLSPGQYHAWLVKPLIPGATPSCDFEVAISNPEMRQLTMNQKQLRLVAERSGGRFVPIDQFDQIDDALPKGEAIRVESLRPRPIWNWWGFAALFVTLLSVEWMLRKRSGML